MLSYPENQSEITSSDEIPLRFGLLMLFPLDLDLRVELESIEVDPETLEHGTFTLYLALTDQSAVDGVQGRLELVGLEVGHEDDPIAVLLVGDLARGQG